MGYYINPVDQTKEQWLMENAERVNRPETVVNEDGNVYICLVDNPTFTAAGICFDDNELEAFTDPNDTRRKAWFITHREKVIQQHPALEAILR